MSSQPPESHKKPKSHFRLLGIAVVLVFVALTTAILLLGTGYTERRGPTRATSEIAALSAAIEGYKADHGTYPSDPKTTEQLRPNSTFNPEAYIASSEFLYSALSGNASSDIFQNERRLPKTKTSARGRTYFVDAWGNSYGYSTFKAAHPESNEGYNPTFDLWSTGDSESGDKSIWITNW